MELSSILRIAVAVAAGFAVVALSSLMAQARSLGIKPIYARPAGSGARGVFYAFFEGMLPWAKESVGKHIPTFVAGISYHIGILSGLITLILCLVRIAPSEWIAQILRAVLVAGIVCGIGLLVKRFSLPKMRLISTVDDAVSNILVDLFLMAALAASFSQSYETILFFAAIVLFIYIPLGKIRHCVFFFFTRVIFGLFYGRRGVLPPSYGERGVR